VSEWIYFIHPPRDNFADTMTDEERAVRSVHFGVVGLPHHLISEGDGGMPSFTTVEDYLASLPVERRSALEELRATITAAAPEANETIAYQMPALRSHGGQFLVSYAAYRHHYSLFPASGAVVEALGDELTPFLSGKGTIRFPANQPIPVALVKRIVQVRLAENAAHARR